MVFMLGTVGTPNIPSSDLPLLFLSIKTISTIKFLRQKLPPRRNISKLYY